MIRNIAGIMADEEPKTPVSPSGLYNTYNLNDSICSFSDVSLSGRSEFTFMVWMNVNFNDGDPDPYEEISPLGIIPIKLSTNDVTVDIDNSNGGRVFITHSIPNSSDVWNHWCVTGSVSNGRARVYKDGVLLTSATMTYSNISSNLARLKQEDTDIAQLNIYDRELTEAEVAEHYVYDDDTMTSGVLGFDAMNPAQKSGLIYSSSFIEDVSIAGGEFNDKSGNNITLSPQPSLTGEQIYVYTDASDLPSDTAIYPVSSANPNGTNQSFYNTSYDMTGKFTNFGWSCWVKLVDAPGVGQTILRASSVSSDITLLYDWGTLDPSLADKIVVGWFGGSWEYISTSNFTLGQWMHLVVSKNGSNWKLYIDGTEEIDYTALAEPYTTGTAVFGTEHRTFVQKLASACSQYYMANQALDQTDVDNLYNNGTPYCLADLPTVTKNKMSNHWKLGTFNGSTEADAVIDQIGSVDFTNNGSTPFTGTGLSVECGGSPPPSNALPSSLPTIL